MSQGHELPIYEPQPGNPPRLDISLRILMKDVGLKREPSSHVHKNDEDYGRRLAEISENSVTSDKTRVAMIVGNGAVLSSLPNIPADIVVTVDQNPFIHEWNYYTAQALLQASAPAEYQNLVYNQQNLLYRELHARNLNPERRLQVEMDDLGNLHFLSSQERFNECKSALPRKQLINSAVDLTNRSALQAMAGVFSQNNAEITFANMTNVWEVATDRLETSLSVLPFHPQAIILQSSYAYTARGYPQMMKPSIGLPHYFDSAKSAYNTVRRLAEK